jgi:heme exporter protein B
MQHGIMSYLRKILAIVHKDIVAELRTKEMFSAMFVSGVLGLNRAFVMEKDRGCLEGLLLAPVDHTAIYFGKMISTVLFMLVVEALMIPVFTAFFGVNLFDLRLLLIVVLGTVGFASVGTILSAMTAQTRAREVLLPILLLPVAAPVLIAAVKATAGILDGLTMGEMARWWQLLLAFAVIFPAVAFMTFDYVVKE